MGSSSSTPTPLEKVADILRKPETRKIVVMVGAGISTSAGIPDFRSPVSGLYANLARLRLPHPEAVFELDFFKRNPLPFYALAKELYPGRHRPTLSHSFIKLLSNHSLLELCFTQNIDTLERRAGIPSDRIIEAHGSFEGQHCISCHEEYPLDKMKSCIQTGDIPTCGKCRGFVKPDIVFFGESLPPAFFEGIPKLTGADLLIVMGTSLTVNPFASLLHYAARDCPRVLINMDEVGDFSRPKDVVLLGKCDEIAQKLCRELGWEDELLAEWATTADSLDKNPMPQPEKSVMAPETPAPGSRTLVGNAGTRDLLSEITEKMAGMALPLSYHNDPTETMYNTSSLDSDSDDDSVDSETPASPTRVSRKLETPAPRDTPKADIYPTRLVVEALSKETTEDAAASASTPAGTSL